MSHNRTAVILAFGMAAIAASRGFAQKSADLPTFTAHESDEWKPVDMSNLNVKPGSALDFERFFSWEPVGVHGRVIVNREGNLAFEKKPDTALTFYTCSLGDFGALKTKDEAKQFADLIRRQGYNLVRPHFLDHFLMAGARSDFDFNLERLDLLDYFIYCLKERGIYIFFDAVTSYSGYKKGSGWSTTGVDLKSDIMTDPAVREHWKTGVTKLMTHVNPYTKTKLVDDPIVAVLLFYNELEMYVIKKGPPPAMLGPWRDFLRRRYHDDPKQVERAWNNRRWFKPGWTFDDIPLFSFESQFGGGANYYIDLGLFLLSTEQEMGAWFERTIREIGYKGLTTLWDMGKHYRNAVARADLPVISMHNYFSHPTSFISPGSKVEQLSSLANAGSWWRSMASTRFIDRPFLIMEYGQLFWSGNRYEEGLLMGAYSGLQGFQGLTVHASPVRTEAKLPIRPFDAASDPIGRANQVQSLFLFARRDVRTSSKYVELSFDSRYLTEKGVYNRAVGAENKLALLYKVGVWQKDQHQYGAKPKPLTVISASGGAQVATTDATMTVVEPPDKAGDIEPILVALKKQRQLPAGNLTNPASGVFQSETGEILMESNQHTLTVITPRFEGIATDRDGPRQLDAVTAVRSSVPSAASVIALDGLPVADSRHLLLVYSTDALNSGMQLSSDHTVLHALGQGPVLVRTGTLDLALRNRHTRSLKIWALAFDGSRDEELHASHTDDEWRISIATGKLKKGPALFFEIAEK